MKNRQTAPSEVGSRPDEIRTRLAGPSDVDALVRLINAAFVVERPIFDGDRTTAAGVRALLQRGKFLVAEDSKNIAGWNEIDAVGFTDDAKKQHWAVAAEASSTFAPPRPVVKDTASELKKERK